MLGPGYVIRLAEGGDVQHLPEIERAAAELLRGELPSALLAETRSDVELEAAQQQGLLWVAALGGMPVGFALIRMLARRRPHLEEMDVHPRHGRQGLGKGLVQAAIEWGRANQQHSLTLTTFRHLPWNMPFYVRLGFVELSPAELEPELAELLRDEAARGLDPYRRVVLCHPLAHGTT